MLNQPKTRQELYDLIRQSSKQEFIYAEMVRLGFWPSAAEEPSLSAQVIARRMELYKELRELVKKGKAVDDPDKLLRDYRKQRLEASREKQVQNRAAREAARLEKAKVWAERKQKEILYLGEEVSGGLSELTTNETALAKYELPDFESALALATAMKITLSQLKFLAYNRKVSKVSHYKRFYMKKKSGGQRLISAPMPRLKKAQYWILENILNKVHVHEKAHGFKQGASILTNAQMHQQQDVVVNLDFKDFFPTITFKRVKGVFHNLGYSEQIASILAVICTEPDVDEVEMDGQIYYTAKGVRCLPQGAPTSPALTNILCYKMDARLSGMAKQLNYKYSRYADDLSFSASGENVEKLTSLLWRVRSITEDEGFVLHPDKLRIMRKGSRQEVTGIVVNDGLSVNRKAVRKFRALLHQIRKTGWEGKYWGAKPIGEGSPFQHQDIVSTVWGYANFIAMVKPVQGNIFLGEVKSLLKLHKRKPLFERPTKESIDFDAKVKTEQAKKNKSEGEDKKKPRWRLW